MYIRNGLNFDARNISIPSLEFLAIDVLLPSTKPVTFAVCYRPPKDNTFVERLQSAFNSLNLSNEIFLMGDFNICFQQKSSLFKAYSDLLQSFSFTQLINEPTRVTSETSSIIDHVICNPLAKVCKSGVLDVTLSDHQFTYFTRGRLHSPCLKPVIRKFRSLRNYCKESFCNLLREVDWNPVLLETNVEIALGCFSGLLLGVIEKIAPYHEVKVKHDSAPWMCREILVGIRKRDLLFRRFKQNRNDKSLYAAYCKQRNLVQRDIKMAKTEFFKGKVNECGRDSAKLWRRLNSLGY